MSTTLARLAHLRHRARAFGLGTGTRRLEMASGTPWHSWTSGTMLAVFRVMPGWNFGDVFHQQGSSTTRCHWQILCGTGTPQMQVRRDMTTTDARALCNLANFSAWAGAGDYWYTAACVFDSTGASTANKLFLGRSTVEAAEPSSYGSRTAGAGSVENVNSGTPTIGNDGGSFASQIPADLFAVGLWNGTALTDDQIKRALWQWDRPELSWRTLQPTGLYMPGLFDGMRVPDLSGNGNHAVAIETPIVAGPPRQRKLWPVGVLFAETGTAFTHNAAGALAPSGVLTKSPARILAGALAPAGVLVRQVARALAGSLTPSGALAAIRTVLVSLAGAIAPAGALLRSTSRTLAGSLTPTGAVVRHLARALAGAITPSATLAAIKTALVSLAGAVAPAGSLTRRTTTTLAGAVTSAGALIRHTTRSLAGTLTPSGALAAVRTVVIALAGSLASSGALVKRTGRSLAGALTPDGGVVKAISTTLAGAIGFAGALASGIVGAITAFLRMLDRSRPRYVIVDRSLARYRITLT